MQKSSFLIEIMSVNLYCFFPKQKLIKKTVVFKIYKQSWNRNIRFRTNNKKVYTILLMFTKQELSSCHKFCISNHYLIFTPQFRRPLIFQTFNSDRFNNLSLKYKQGIHHRVTKICRYENFIWWQILSFFEIVYWGLLWSYYPTLYRINRRWVSSVQFYWI